MKKQTGEARDRILAAAKRLFATKGYEATSVKEICTEADVNVSLIYYYFQDKENVLIELLETNLKEFKKLAAELPIDDPVAGIRKIAGEIITFRLEDPEMMTILHREILSEGLRHEKIRKYIYPLWDKLHSLLLRGQDIGIFQFESIDQVFQIIISAMLFPRINPHFLAPRFKENQPNSEVLLDHTMHFILGGLYYQERN